MKANEKAKELVKMFKPFAEMIEGMSDNTEQAKQCALICVDQLIKNAAWKNESYYKEVEQEIEKL